MRFTNVTRDTWKFIICFWLLSSACIVNGSSQVSAATSPGVAEGDWIRYTVTASGSSSAIDPVIFTIEWLEFTFQTVNDSEVTARVMIHYRNGTEDASTIHWNVLSGEELWVIPVGLQAGDIIPWGYTSINATVNRSYLGTERTVNLVELQYRDGSSSEQMWIYWDQATGLLMELTLEIHNGVAVSMYQYLATAQGREPSLALSLQLSSPTVIQGETVLLSCHLTDTDQWPVINASILATLNATTLSLTEHGDGLYSVTFPTSNITPGSYTLTVEAKKAGYLPAQASVSLTVLLAQLTLTLMLSTSHVSHGNPVTVSATITDPADRIISGASVTATAYNITTPLTDLENGTYRSVLDTTFFPEGTHTIHVTVQKSGYPLAHASVTLTLTPPENPWIPYLLFIGLLASSGVGIQYYRHRRSLRSRVE